MPVPFLSIIFPAYNEELRLAHALDQTISYLKTQPFTYEVLVVENGSSDQTLSIAQKYASEHPEIHVHHSERAGKGLAVQLGMLAAQR